MTRLHTFLFLLASAGLLAGCATASRPPLTAADPASPDAREGARTAAHSSLRADELTQKTRAQLSAAASAQKEWDEHGPVSGTPADESAPAKPNAMPGMDHDKMKGMNHDNH